MTAELHILKTAKGTWRSGSYSAACGARGKGFLLMVPLESLWAKVKVEVCPEELRAATSHPDACPSRLQSKCSPSEDENTRNLKKRCEGQRVSLIVPQQCVGTAHFWRQSGKSHRMPSSPRPAAPQRASSPGRQQRERPPVQDAAALAPVLLSDKGPSI